jgi:wobble nucleotide-excising tRNase
VSKISCLRGTEVFADFPPPANDVQFLRYNLIYGFNGSGKTTLSRLFECLRDGGDRSYVSDGAECTFELTDGSSVSLQTDMAGNPLASKIAVFNEDFVERSLTWKSGSAKPIVYIGEAQAEIAAEIDAKSQAVADLRADDTLKASEWASQNKALDTFKRDTARLIANELNLGRNYTALQLKADFAAQKYTPDDRLSETTVKEDKELLNRTDSAEAVPYADLDLDIDSIASSVAACLRSTVQTLTIDALKRRADALPWVREGIGLHASEADCLFCGQHLPRNRLADLKVALGSGFEELRTGLAKAHDSLQAAITRLREARERLPASFAGYLPKHRAPLKASSDALRKLTNSAEEALIRWDKQLTDKAQAADTAIVLDRHENDPSAEEIRKADAAWKEAASEHNEEVKRFKELQQEARDRLKRHHLAQSQSGYDEAVRAEAESKNASTAARERLESADNELHTLREKLIEHAPAAEVLNPLIASYLGHKRITVKVTDDGYRICRDGKVAVKPLSEGEKTAIAFCYFLIGLNSEGRKIEDLIVVVDDPISSLDTRAMTFVFSLVKSKLNAAAQLFILTHNLEFMREVKKWLNKRYRDEKTANFMFVESSASADGKRFARLVRLPPLIQEYDSEYHYLYSLVSGLVEDPEAFERFAYLMPNAIRKVLEIFLAFKLPGSAGLGDKINQLVAGKNLEEARVRSMEHLAQMESHADNIGDVVTFSGFTLEQVKDAAETLLSLIETADPEHRKAMDHLCRKARAKA